MILIAPKHKGNPINDDFIPWNREFPKAHRGIAPIRKLANVPEMLVNRDFRLFLHAPFFSGLRSILTVRS